MATSAGTVFTFFALNNDAIAIKNIAAVITCLNIGSDILF
jgi:hypothetical protein